MLMTPISPWNLGSGWASYFNQASRVMEFRTGAAYIYIHTVWQKSHDKIALG